MRARGRGEGGGEECGSLQHLGQLLALGSPLRSPGETLGTWIRIWSSGTERIELERGFSRSLSLFLCIFYFPFFSLLEKIRMTLDKLIMISAGDDASVTALLLP